MCQGDNLEIYQEDARGRRSLCWWSRPVVRLRSCRRLPARHCTALTREFSPSRRSESESICTSDKVRPRNAVLTNDVAILCWRVYASRQGFVSMGRRPTVTGDKMCIIRPHHSSYAQMRHIVTDGITWPFDHSVAPSVSLSQWWALEKRLNRSRCRLGCEFGCVQGSMKV